MSLSQVLRSAGRRCFPFNSPSYFHLQSLRLSRVRLSSLRFDGIPLNVWQCSQRRMICSSYFKKIDVAETCTFRIQQENSLKLFSSLISGQTRRFTGTRVSSNSSSAFNERNRTTAIYVIALAITVMGFSYLAVPLYRLFCQVSCVL